MERVCFGIIMIIDNSDRKYRLIFSEGKSHALLLDICQCNIPSIDNTGSSRAILIEYMTRGPGVYSVASIGLCDLRAQRVKKAGQGSMETINNIKHALSQVGRNVASWWLNHGERRRALVKSRQSSNMPDIYSSSRHRDDPPRGFLTCFLLASVAQCIEYLLPSYFVPLSAGQHESPFPRQHGSRRR